MDDVKDSTKPLQVVRSQMIELLLPVEHLEAIKQVAASKGVAYQTLIHAWLVEKLREEAPDLLPR